MLIYPKYGLTGYWLSGNPNTDYFKLWFANPYSATNEYKEFYDSRNTIGKFYVPDLEYLLTHTLIDTKGKLSPKEKQTPSYGQAVSAGSTTEVVTGTPAWIEVPQSLRTWIGGTESSGYLGEVIPGIRTMGTSNKENLAWQNAQRWHYRFSLPKNTLVMFTDASGNPKTPSFPFEQRSKDQVFYVEMVYRTKGGFDVWDLTTLTNTSGDLNYGLPIGNYGNHVEVDCNGLPTVPAPTLFSDINHAAVGSNARSDCADVPYPINSGISPGANYIKPGDPVEPNSSMRLKTRFQREASSKLDYHCSGLIRNLVAGELC
jgi:hypothetical protein